MFSVTLPDQHRVVTELVGPKVNLETFKEADVNEGPEELTSRKRERRGQKTFVDTTTIDRSTWSLPLVDSDRGASC